MKSDVSSLQQAISRAKELWHGRPNVWVVSYPKSGRTWMELMVARIYHLLTGEPVEELLFTKYRRLRHQGTSEVIPLLHFRHGYHFKQTLCRTGNFPGIYYRQSRIVLLMRDPRDIVVSNYYHRTYRSKTFHGSLRDFIRLDFQNEPDDSHITFCGIKSIINYYNSWVANRHLLKAFLVLGYEDLHANTKETLRTLLVFCGIEAADEQLDDAVEYASFDNMQSFEMEGRFRWKGLNESREPNGLKARRGQVGGYRDEMNADDLAYINQSILDHLSPFFSVYRKAAANDLQHSAA